MSESHGHGIITGFIYIKAIFTHLFVKCWKDPVKQYEHSITPLHPIDVDSMHVVCKECGNHMEMRNVKNIKAPYPNFGYEFKYSSYTYETKKICSRLDCKIGITSNYNDKCLRDNETDI